MSGWKWRAGHGIWIGLIILGVALSACQPKDRKGEIQSLEQRVAGFWESRVQRDYSEAYWDEASSHNCTSELAVYLAQQSSAMKFKSFVVDEVQEDGDKAKVKVGVDYTMQGPMMPEIALYAVVEEEWIRLDKGQWYRDTKPWRPSQNG